MKFLYSLLLVLLLTGKMHAGINENILVEKSAKLEEYALYDANLIKEHTDEIFNLVAELNTGLVVSNYNLTKEQREIILERIVHFMESYQQNFVVR